MQPQVEASTSGNDVIQQQQQWAADKQQGVSAIAGLDVRWRAPLLTSTPEHRNSQHYCNLAKSAVSATSKRYNIFVGGVGVGSGSGNSEHSVTTFDRLFKIFLFSVILIIGYKSLILTMPYINATNIQLITSYVEAQLLSAQAWSEEQQLSAKLKPILCGLLMAAFSCGFVYLDSAVPGVNPPTPFSPRSKERYREGRSSLHLGYFCALAAGLIVGILMYIDV